MIDIDLTGESIGVTWGATPPFVPPESERKDEVESEEGDDGSPSWLGPMALVALFGGMIWMSKK